MQVNPCTRKVWQLSYVQLYCGVDKVLSLRRDLLLPKPECDCTPAEVSRTRRFGQLASRNFYVSGEEALRGAPGLQQSSHWSWSANPEARLP